MTQGGVFGLLFTGGGRNKCSPQDCAGRSLPQRRPATHFAFVCALRRLLPENISVIMSAVL